MYPRGMNLDPALSQVIRLKCKTSFRLMTRGAKESAE